jgi:hypothetical protein
MPAAFPPFPAFPAAGIRISFKTVFQRHLRGIPFPCAAGQKIPLPGPAHLFYLTRILQFLLLKYYKIMHAPAPEFPLRPIINILSQREEIGYY